jgi:hypothetical protein
VALTASAPPALTGERTRQGRFETARADGGLLYFIPEPQLAERLLGLGLGFQRGGLHEEGSWLLRHDVTRTLAELPKNQRLSWDESLRIAAGIAHDLGRCERAHVFIGPLVPGDIALVPDGAFILAKEYVAALSGAREDAAEHASGPSPSYTPPEQLDGAPWDSAANRYVLGLVLYRLLTGAPPFRGDGARAAFAAGRTDVIPLPEDVARGLPPGLHAFLLRMLSPDAEKRPRSADEILRELTGTGAKKVTMKRPGVELRPAAPANVAARLPRGTWLRMVGALLLVVVAVVAAVTAVQRGTYGGASPSSSSSARPPEERPMTLARSQADACVGCHAREVSEWRRSVMSRAATSPLFGALESVVEEQVGRSSECPNGAGILRKRGADVCQDRRSGTTLTGAGGEHWCVNCHLPGENLSSSMPPWSSLGAARGSGGSRSPVKDLASASSMEGISCISCHTTVGPVHLGQAYQGNPTWTSFQTGTVFGARPEDATGRSGIGNSGYALDATSFFTSALSSGGARVHKLPSSQEKAYLRSSEFCGSCHDVRLFGTDVLGARDRGEHFKRLRNGYSEWRSWAQDQARAGRPQSTCQDCHMSTFPGVCVQDASSPGGKGCPAGTRFSARSPGDLGRSRHVSHDFTSVEVPLAIDPRGLDEDLGALDPEGVPLGLAMRQTMLLARALTFDVGKPEALSGTLRFPVDITNTGAGHRVPAGFSQEREIWVELTVKDADGRVVYDVGKVGKADEDLADKRFLRIRTDDGVTDGKGRPLGLFGADVADGPDVPAWKKSAPNERRGKGLINLQNGFLRCVRCIGQIDANGVCQPVGDQGRTRSDRFDDGDYDIDTGECRSNLTGENALFETFFPIGALDADRGIAKAPDAIIDTRSAAPGVRQRWVYELPVASARAPFTVTARLRFRAFPPYLLRAFADYEARRASLGERPSGAQVTSAHTARLRILDVAEVVAHGP